MGRRGPPKKPTSLKKAQGTYTKSRDTDLVSEQAMAGAPRMPSDLKDAALRRWNEIVPELLRIGTLAVIDGGALEAYCRAFGRWVKLEEMAEMSITGDAAVESRKLHKEVIAPLELALGLHYAARNKVKMPAKKDERDPVEEDIFGPLKVVNGGREEPPAGTE